MGLHGLPTKGIAARLPTDVALPSGWNIGLTSPAPDTVLPQRLVEAAANVTPCRTVRATPRAPRAASYTIRWGTTRRHDQGSDGHPGQGAPAGARRTAREREPGLRDDRPFMGRSPSLRGASGDRRHAAAFRRSAETPPSLGPVSDGHRAACHGRAGASDTLTSSGRRPSLRARGGAGSTCMIRPHMHIRKSGMAMHVPPSVPFHPEPDDGARDRGDRRHGADLAAARPRAGTFRPPKGLMQ